MSSVCSVVAFGQCHLVSTLLWDIATDTDTNKVNATSKSLRILVSFEFEWESGATIVHAHNSGKHTAGAGPDRDGAGLRLPDLPMTRCSAASANISSS